MGETIGQNEFHIASDYDWNKLTNIGQKMGKQNREWIVLVNKQNQAHAQIPMLQINGQKSYELIGPSRMFVSGRRAQVVNGGHRELIIAIQTAPPSFSLARISSLKRIFFANYKKQSGW